MSDMVAISFVLLMITASAYAEEYEKEGMHDQSGAAFEEYGDPGPSALEEGSASNDSADTSALDGELDSEATDAHASLPSYNNPVPEPVVKQSKLYGAETHKEKSSHKLSREEKLKKALAKKPKAKKSKQQLAKNKKKGKIQRGVASKGSAKKFAKRSTSRQKVRR